MNNNLQSTQIVAIVVDDEPANRDFITRLLQTAGVEVHSAETGAEVLHLAQSLSTLTIALVDHELPDCHGVDLVKALRKHHPNAVLGMATMHDHRDLIEQAFDAGADLFLVKPHGFMELYRRISEKPFNADSLRRLIIDQYGPRSYRGHTRTVTAVGA